MGRRRLERRAALAAIAVCSLLAAAAPPAGAAAPATLDSIVVEPDGPGVRVQIALSGPFHYLVTPHEDRIVVALDGVAAGDAAHPLALGPVTGVAVRPARGHAPLADVVVTTRVPLALTDSFLADGALVIRLAPGDAAAPFPARAAAAPAEPPAAREAPGVIAGRAVIPRALSLEAGAGRVLQIDGLLRVAVSDPQVLGAVPVSSRELLVTGRSAGRTTMYVWEGSRRLLAYTVDVVPAADRIARLRRLLALLFPDAAVAVEEVPPAPGQAAPSPAAASPVSPAPPVSRPTLSPPGGAPGTSDAPSPPAPAGTLILSGTVETQMDRQRVEQVAHAFAPGVVDLLSVRRPVQLKLQVEVAELNRSALRSLGVTWGGGQQLPGASPSLNGGVYNLQVLTGPAAGTSGLDLLIAQIQALTQRGLARLLAEPSLVVLAGQAASLLLGGQVPIPVAGPNGTVTLEYKDFGVILDARADYQDDGRVFMQIAPEVSTLDFSNAIKVSGFTIPALRVRRAQTAVSMLPAQTLVLGGLLERQDADLVQKVPLLGDLPILGPLFRSRTFQRQESDLVIFVTPVLAETGGAPPNPP